jgi:DNA-directed RNA polymerase subunit RPC12/RpoP
MKMARKHIETCVGCTSMGLPCRGRSCSNYNGTFEYTCDECEKEYNPEELYDVDGEMLCADCLLNRFKTIAEIEEE